MIELRIFMALALILSMPVNVQAQPSYDSSATEAEIRFQQLEKEIRRLTGLVEEQNYEIRRLRGELLKATGDLEMRVSDLENGGRVFTSSSENSSNDNMNNDTGNISSSDGGVVIEPDPKTKGDAAVKIDHILGTINKSQDSGEVSSFDSAPKAYEHAYSFIKQRDFERAEKEFAKFMVDFPDHPLVANAKYWYGETFYVRGGYEKSARIFAEGYKQFPKGPKAASNLLKLGMALTGMGKTDDACVAYKQLKKDYAKSSVPVLKRAETEMKRINCH